MKRTLITLAMTLSVAAPAMADMALATSKNCMACHAVDKKLVGPSYKDVAKKYAGDAKAADKLGVSQPAVSNSLSKLRRLFDDGRQLGPPGRAVVVAGVGIDQQQTGMPMAGQGPPVDVAHGLLAPAQVQPHPARIAAAPACIEAERLLDHQDR